MIKNESLSNRIRAIMQHFGLNVNELAEKVGGSKVKFYNLLSEKSKPDYDTTEGFLRAFPSISAEWFFRGEGAMLKGESLDSEEQEALRQENKVLSRLYQKAIEDKLLGKFNGMSFRPSAVKTNPIRRSASRSVSVPVVRKTVLAHTHKSNLYGFRFCDN